jgi:hypothetical protein
VIREYEFLRRSTDGKYAYYAERKGGRKVVVIGTLRVRASAFEEIPKKILLDIRAEK